MLINQDKANNKSDLRTPFNKRTVFSSYTHATPRLREWPRLCHFVLLSRTKIGALIAPGKDAGCLKTDGPWSGLHGWRVLGAEGGSRRNRT
jgi:hypothetical protein